VGHQSTYSNVGCYEDAWDQDLDPGEAWSMVIEEAIPKTIFGSLRVHNARGRDLEIVLLELTAVVPSDPNGEATATLIRERINNHSMVTVFTGIWIPGPEARVLHTLTITNHSSVNAPTFVSLSGWVSTITWDKSNE